MRIGLIGATGFVGTNLCIELARRNHEIIGISRTMQFIGHSIAFVRQDVLQYDNLARFLKHCDVVVSAFNPGPTDCPDLYDAYMAGSKSIQKAVTLSGVKRFIVIGVAGSLYSKDNVQLVDTAHYPEELRMESIASRDYLDLIRKEKELDWVYFSPAMEMRPGTSAGRTGQYRLGTDFPVLNAQGKSELSVEDMAMVIADEIETPKHHQTHFTAAY